MHWIRLVTDKLLVFFFFLYLLYARVLLLLCVVWLRMKNDSFMMLRSRRWFFFSTHICIRLNECTSFLSKNFTYKYLFKILFISVRHEAVFYTRINGEIEHVHVPQLFRKFPQRSGRKKNEVNKPVKSFLYKQENKTKMHGIALRTAGLTAPHFS